MREVKFRGWSTVFKNMEMPSGFGGGPGEDLIDYIEGMLARNDVIMQFTGLLDKNGKEIYEGDILKDPILGEDEICRVEWDDGGFITICEDDEHGNGYDSLRKRGDLMEVIGNIYENPELVK